MNRSYALSVQEVETRRAKLQAELCRAAEPLSAAGYLVATEVCFGEPARTIIDLVKSNSIDLIAMTTHGRTGVGRLVMGSVAESVARAVNVPVLLWRPALQPGEAQPAPGEALAQMLRQLQALQLAVATDSSTFGQEAVTLTADLTKQFDANLALLAIASEYNSLEHSQQLMQNASRLVESLEPRPNLIPLVGYADEVVLQYLDKNPTDLLAIGAFQDRSAGSKAIGTMAHRLVQYAPTSMLMYIIRPGSPRFWLVHRWMMLSSSRWPVILPKRLGRNWMCCRERGGGRGRRSLQHIH